MANLLFVKEALLLDENGCHTDKNELITTRDFDEIRQWSDQVYMPYLVDPIEKYINPNSTLHARKAGCMIISRFTYGIPVHLKKFSMDAGMGMVLTTANGHARHWIDRKTTCETSEGGSFVVDTSRTDYWAEFDPDHLQVNITFPHNYLARLYTQISGLAAPRELWRHKAKFDTRNTNWLSLLEYVLRTVSLNSEEAEFGILGRHLEEMIGTSLLIQWSKSCGIDLCASTHSIAPKSVVKAEEFIREHACEVPTMTEIARAAGVSVRSLSGAFKKFRNTTAMAYMRECRLQGVRAELLRNGSHARVSEIAYSWGYINLGRFAARYRQRFGELPSETVSKNKFF